MNSNQMAALEAARQAFSQHEWASASEGYAALENDGATLGGEDLEAYGYAVTLKGDDEMEVLERSVDAYDAEGRVHDAVRVALDLARMHLGKGRPPIGMGWARRAQRMLEGQDEGGGHAHVEAFNSFMLQLGGQLSEALGLAERAHALAREHGDVDAECLALNRRGRILVQLARAEEGKADLDEAMLLVRRGMVRPIAAAIVYCSTIDGCSDMGDYERALVWTEAAESWLAARRVCGFPGICQVHRAQLRRICGDLEGARQAAEEAIQTFERFQFRMNIPQARAELAQQMLEAGDLEGAAIVFAELVDQGAHPLPGLATLALHQGDPKRARDLLEPKIEKLGENRLERARLLPILVEASLQLGELEAAKRGASELEAAAEDFGTVGFRARASTARAQIHLYERNATEALHSARAATREWNVVGAAYELSRARELLTRAHTLAGDSSRARVAGDVVNARLDELSATATQQAVVATEKAASSRDGVPPPLARQRIAKGITLDDKLDVGPMLGAGGMGVVYRGRHRITGREVAIKVLHPSLCGDDAQCGRFMQEALACGRIKHRNVVDVYDAGRHGHEPYIVMELLSGETLASRLERAGNLEIDEALDLAEQAARGLGAAHEAGVIHRDIKPENLFVCAGPDPIVKVLDFGISKLPDAGRTRTGALLGTPYYMAPEQVNDGSAVDSRTDVHAVGAVLFEMLAGRPPYAGDGAMAVIHAIARGPVPSVSSLRPDLPHSAAAVVDRALNRDPALRFASGTELADALANARSSLEPR